MVKVGDKIKHGRIIWDTEYEIVEERPKIKVGDKARVTNAFVPDGYVNGDVLEVIALDKYGTGAYVRTPYATQFHGANADREIQQPFTYLLNREFEVIEMPSIKIGDKIKLIDKFYEHEAFKSDSRHIRKQIASLKDTELEAKGINEYANRVSTGEINYSIPIELLEKAEQLPKPGDLFKVIGNSGVPHYFENGEIVTLVQPFGWVYDCICNGYCKHHGGIYDQVIRISDIEPYTKHRYTDEQIAEAQRIIGEIVASLPDWDNYAFSRTGRRTHMYINNQTTKKHAVCMETDEYNQTIGRMITLCKHVGRPLPKWL